MNSKAISHMKKSWKVLPFHINSKEAWGDIDPKYMSDGFRIYKSSNGVVKAISGSGFMRLPGGSILLKGFFSIVPITYRKEVTSV
jgi:hypothetical protein